MTSLIISTLIGAVSFIVGSYLLKGVTVVSFSSAVIISILIAVLTYFLGGFLEFITPDKTLNFLTFGFFQFFLDAIIIWLASKLMKSFEVKGFITAVLLAIIVSVVTCLCQSIL